VRELIQIRSPRAGVVASFYDPTYGVGRTVLLAALSVAVVRLVAGAVADRRQSEPAAVGI
jgi:hypothetical protein